MPNMGIRVWTLRARRVRGEYHFTYFIHYSEIDTDCDVQIWLGQCQLCVRTGYIECAYATGFGSDHAV